MALVIKRRQSESFWIGGVKVQVVSVGPAKVKIEIDAPLEVDIARDELLTDAQRLFRWNCFRSFAKRFRRALDVGKEEIS